MIAAIQHCHDRSADHSTRIVKNLSWFEYVAQMGESMAAELIVAKRLGYEYTPGITWDKSKADVGEHIEVKWSANPNSNLWIQDSDRHDRDIAVLVTGNTPKMHIVGWMPVAVAKKPRHRVVEPPDQLRDINATHAFSNELRHHCKSCLDTCGRCISMSNQSCESHQGFDTLCCASGQAQSDCHLD